MKFIYILKYATKTYIKTKALLQEKSIIQWEIFNSKSLFHKAIGLDAHNSFKQSDWFSDRENLIS